MKFCNKTILSGNRFKCDIRDRIDEVKRLILNSDFQSSIGNSSKFLYLGINDKYCVVSDDKDQFYLLTSSYKVISFSDLKNILEGKYEVR